MTARSFLSEAEGFERALGGARASVGKLAGAIVFVSGALAQAAPRVAEVARKSLRGAPFCVVPAAGVLSERGEIEGAAHASGVLWGDGSAAPIAFDEGTDAGEHVAAALGGKAGTAILFTSKAGFVDGFADFSRKAPRATVLGAGTVGAPALVFDERANEVKGDAAVGLVVRGLSPIVRSAPSCRLLTELDAIDEVDAGMVLRIGGTPALDKLSASATATTVKPGVAAPHPVVFAALADGDAKAEDEPFLVRPLRGIDPGRRGVLVGPEARLGVRMGFAVRDGAASRARVEAMAREVAQASSGSAPRFALWLTCAGRGQGLYGGRDVEARILRQRFGDLPIAGMHAGFEILPWGEANEPRLGMYAGVLALFRSPS